MHFRTKKKHVSWLGDLGKCFIDKFHRKKASSSAYLQPSKSNNLWVIKKIISIVRMVPEASSEPFFRNTDGFPELHSFFGS